MKNYLLYAVLLCLIPCLAFYGNGNEVNWLWKDLIYVPLTLAFTSLVCIGLHLYKEESIKSTILVKETKI